MRTPAERLAAGLPESLPAEKTEKQRVLRDHAETTKQKARAKAADHAAAAAGELPVDLSVFDANGDLIDIWERRMVNPDQRQAHPIRIKTPGMHMRWVNLAQTGRYQRARYEEGWVPVLKPELVDEREIYGVSYTTEGFVCRGEKQNEMLMKMPEAVFKKIRARKIELVKKSQKNLNDEMQSAGAKHFGDKYSSSRGAEIADTMGQFRGAVKFGTEHVEADPDIAPDLTAAPDATS